MVDTKVFAALLFLGGFYRINLSGILTLITNALQKVTLVKGQSNRIILVIVTLVTFTLFEHLGDEITISPTGRGGSVLHNINGGYQILVQKVFEGDLSCDGRCMKLKF